MEQIDQVCLLQSARTPFLNWQRSSTNPFADERERIGAWVRTYPEQSTRDLFEELQRLFPGRYQASQYSALQRYVRKIRTSLRSDAGEGPCPIEIIHGPLSGLPMLKPEAHMELRQSEGMVLFAASALVLASQDAAQEAPLPDPVPAEEERPSETDERAGDTFPPLTCGPHVFSSLPIELAVQFFLQEQRAGRRTDKTLDWHQRALRSFQQYLAQQNKRFSREITTAVVRDWLAQLRAEPTKTGTLRSASTVHSTARSARAFCIWLVRQGYLERTPFVKGTVPKLGYHPIQIVEPEVFAQLVHACGPCGEMMDHATIRNRALLWVLLETGLLLSEVCALRLGDLNRDTGRLTITANGLKARHIPLGENAFRFLLRYLDQSRLTRGGHLVGEAPLFLSERGQPLTPNAITLLFLRLSSRAGMSEKGVTPSALRDTFAVRYLQQGGYPNALQKLLGLANKAALKRYQEAAQLLPPTLPARSYT